MDDADDGGFPLGFLEIGQEDFHEIPEHGCDANLSPSQADWPLL